MPLLYWTAAALGLAISTAQNDASMLARLPEVEALLNRALELDPAWDDGALHAFQVTFASARPGRVDRELVGRSYQRAVELSRGGDAAVHVAYAEAVAVPDQNVPLFRELLDKALAVEIDRFPEDRLANTLAQRRARWLLDRIEDLFLIVEPAPN